MLLKNLTPHVISVKNGGAVIIMEPDGPPVRVKTRLGRVISEENGVTIHAPSRFAGFQNLPDKTPGVYLIVSQICALVAARLHLGRDDLVYPVTSPFLGAERDDHGVLSVSRFCAAS